MKAVKLVALESVITIKGGGTPSTEKAEYWNGSIPWVSPKDMKSDDIGNSIDTISTMALENSAASLLPTNAVLVVTRSGILARTVPIALTTRELTVNQDIKALCANDNIDPRFLFYFMRSAEPTLLGLVTRGATVHRLSTDDIRSLQFPLLPMQEQQRIVAVLDEVFAGIATAKANTEKNLQSARAVFERYLESIFGENHEGWSKRRLGEMCDIGSSKRIYEVDWTSAGVPFYGGREIVRLAKFGVTESKNFISEEKYAEYSARYGMPQAGDIVMTARGTIGTGYVVRDDDKFYYKDGNVISLRPKVGTDSNFVLYAFRTKAILDQCAHLTGATVTHLPIEKANELLIGFPEVATQRVVVGKLREFEKETQRLEGIYRTKLAALDALKQSLLREAFSGRL